MNIKQKSLTVMISSMLLLGCQPPHPPAEKQDSAPEPQTGVLVDAPVGGVSYSTETIANGITNANGEFTFNPGETVTFKIGGITLGSVPAGGIITPLDLAGETDISNNEVVNIARLLQSLDSDSDPDTITISSAVRSALAGASIDFENDFEADAQDLIDAAFGASEVALVSRGAAIAHLEESFAAFIPDDGIGFTPELLAGNSFDLSGFDSRSTKDLLAVEFAANGSGSLDYTEDNASFSYAIEWRINLDGSLEITEFSDDGTSLFGTWVFEPTSILSNGTISATAESRVTFFDPDSEETSSSGQFTPTEALFADYTIDLTGKAASSIIRYSECSAEGGFSYVFRDDELVLEGSDGWNDCALNESSRSVLEISYSDSGDSGDDLFFPTNCEDYPICRYDELNAEVSGTDGDDRAFTSAIRHVAGSDIIMTTKTITSSGEVFTEVIELTDYKLDLREYVATSVVTITGCGSEAGFDYSFDSTIMRRYGTDSIDSESCLIESDESQSFIMSALAPAGEFDLPFNCANYPLCELEDFNFTTDDATATYSHVAGSLTITYVDEISESETVTEILTLSKALDPEALSFNDLDLAGMTFYDIWENDEGCGFTWVNEEISFGSSSYVLEICDESTPEENSYEITEAGLIKLTNAEYIRLIGYDEDEDAYRTCWGDTIAETLECGDNADYWFTSRAKAEAFLATRNSQP